MQLSVEVVRGTGFGHGRSDDGVTRHFPIPRLIKLFYVCYFAFSGVLTASTFLQTPVALKVGNPNMNRRVSILLPKLIQLPLLMSYGS